MKFRIKIYRLSIQIIFEAFNFTNSFKFYKYYIIFKYTYLNYIIFEYNHLNYIIFEYNHLNYIIFEYTYLNFINIIKISLIYLFKLYYF